MTLNLGRRARLALKIAGYSLLALVAFIFALHLTFPYHRVRDKFVESLSSTYDVTVSDVERSWVPGRFALKGVTLTSRPKVAGQPPTIMYFKKIEIDLKLLPLIGQKVELGLDISTGTGHLSGTVSLKGKDVVADLKLRKVPLATLPGISDAVGLPMDGNADGKISLTLINGDWSKKSVAAIELGCSVNCAVGDGLTKIYPKPQRPSDAALYRDGLTVPKIAIDRFFLAIDLKNGEAKRRAFELVSPEGKVEVDFSIKLARQIGSSTINGCIRYQCSVEFQRKYPGLCIGSPIVDEQGMLNIKLSGQVSRMRRLPVRCDTGGGGGGDNAGGPPSRPTIDAIPEVDTTAPVPVTPTPVPPTPVTPTPTPMPTPMPPPPEPPPLDRKMMLDDVGGSVPAPPPMPLPPEGSGPSPGSVPTPGTTGSAPPSAGDTRAIYPGGAGISAPSPGSPGSNPTPTESGR